MKTRKGLVSNSSSSSFIVGFEEIPTSTPQMCEMLFGNDTRYGSPYGPDWWPTMEVAAIVFDDFNRNDGPMTLDEMKEEMQHGWLSGEPEIPWPRYIEDEPAKERHKRWQEYSDQHQRVKRVFVEQVLGRFYNPDLMYFRFSYADGDGPLSSAMEHGGLFDKLPSIQISHH